MKRPKTKEIGRARDTHGASLRESSQALSVSVDLPAVDPRLLKFRVTGSWWEVLGACDITLLITRESEHLVLAINTSGQQPRLSYLPMPHPSGMAVAPSGAALYIASTRNPNQIFELHPATGLRSRAETRVGELRGRPLVPIATTILPGSTYLHDLAFIGNALCANSVSQNAIIRRDPSGRWERVWWPACIDKPRGPAFDRNHLHLNSIAAGPWLADSYFSAAAARPSTRHPDHRHVPADRQGVIFSGRTREPIGWGLTRPHTARLRNRRIWVDNSGYGELGYLADGALQVVSRLPGWTRGLYFYEGVAFVGTSRLMPRFRHYAPGLQAEKCVCGVHAIDVKTGTILGSIVWPNGNQIFAIEGIAADISDGLPFEIGGKGAAKRAQSLFYAFETD